MSTNMEIIFRLLSWLVGFPFSPVHQLSSRVRGHGCQLPFSIISCSYRYQTGIDSRLGDRVREKRCGPIRATFDVREEAVPKEGCDVTEERHYAREAGDPLVGG